MVYYWYTRATQMDWIVKRIDKLILVFIVPIYYMSAIWFWFYGKYLDFKYRDAKKENTND